MKTHQFAVVIENDKDGYFAVCPELQGCFTQGETYEEAMSNIKDAIKLHLEDRAINHEPLPDVASVSLSMVEVGI